MSDFKNFHDDASRIATRILLGKLWQGLIANSPDWRSELEGHRWGSVAIVEDGKLSISGCEGEERVHMEQAVLGLLDQFWDEAEAAIASHKGE